MKRILLPLILLLMACSSLTSELPTATPVPPTVASPATLVPIPPTYTPLPRPTFTPAPTQTAVASLTPMSSVPDFAHIVVVVFENKEYGSVIGNSTMPYYNQLAQQNTLLNAFYAVSHPSLPNYLAMLGGDTFGISSDCIKCFVDAPSLPDLLEPAGLTWRTYQERMPTACFLGDTLLYNQKHNPFIYFTPIRENPDRCQQGIVPLTQLDTDMVAKGLPNFVFITPDLCNDAHDCPGSSADAWLSGFLPKLQLYLDATTQPYLIVLTWDEGQGNHGCCGLPADGAGGRIPVVLISPQAKSAFQDETPYTHYSLLKTISASWHLPYLAHAADPENVLIVAPWK